jgi:hypothetical protein
MSSKKPKEVVFMPGCFDSFDGTQQELDDFVVKIKAMALSGELEEQSESLNKEDLKDLVEGIKDIIDKKMLAGDVTKRH